MQISKWCRPFAITSFPHVIPGQLRLPEVLKLTETQVKWEAFYVMAPEFWNLLPSITMTEPTCVDARMFSWWRPHWVQGWGENQVEWGGRVFRFRPRTTLYFYAFCSKMWYISLELAIQGGF